MPKSSLPKPDTYTVLLGQLELLLEQGSRGYWDELQTIEARLVPMLSQVDITTSHPEQNTGGPRESLMALHSKLQSAIKMCEERKSELLPLIQALDRISQQPQ